MKLVLASGSPRRADVLNTVGLVFEVATPDVDEARRPDESPQVYVERLAREKATAVAIPDAVVVAADTVVVHGGKVLGKPGHPEEARSMLRRLQGARHEAITGMAVAAPGGLVESVVDVTVVTMLAMTEEEIDDYVVTGEPMDKAGAYALQGRAARFIESIEGSPYTVIGLPIHLLARLLASVGSDIHRFSANPGLQSP